MKNNWQTKKLEEVCAIVKDKPQKFSGTKAYYATGSIDNSSGFSMPEFVEYGNRPSRADSYPKAHDIGFAKMKLTNKVFEVNDDLAGSIFSTGFCFLRPGNLLNSKYLFYFVISDEFQKLKDFYAGSGIMGGIKNSDVLNIEISLPPLAEQKRIVKFLDEVFEKTSRAQENTEKNLQNSKELFESYLQNIFTSPKENWDVQKIEDCFKLKSGDGLTSKMMDENGTYLVFGGNGIAGSYNKFNLSGSNVIIGRVGALCGNVRHITEKIWLTDNAFKVVNFKHEFDHSFLIYLLNYKNLRSFARQAAQPVISNSSLKDVLLQFPKSVIEQKVIVKKLDKLAEETEKLANNYSRRLDDLGEFKKSILKMAFTQAL